MKLTQLHEAKYTGAPQSSAIYITFLGEGDRGGIPVAVVGPFTSKEDAKAFLVRLREAAPNMMEYLEIEIKSSIPPQDWLEQQSRYEEEYHGAEFR